MFLSKIHFYILLYQLELTMDLLNKVLNIGNSKSLPFHEWRKVRILNGTCLMGFSSSVFFVPIFIAKSIYSAAFAQSVLIVLFIVAVFLNHKRKYFSARILMLIVLPFVLLYYHVMVHQAGIFYLFLCAVFFATLFNDKTRVFFISQTWLLTIFLMALFIPQDLFINERAIIADIHGTIFDVILVFVVVSFLMYITITDHQRHLSEINEKNNELQASTEEIIAQKEEIEAQNDEIENQNKVLQESNAIKDKLFSIIAHDLKAPFNSLRAVIDILIKEDNVSPEDQKRLLGSINNQLSNSSEMLENLLYWSKSQLSGFQVNAVALDINYVLRSVKQLLKPGADKKGIVLDCSCDDGIILFIDREILKIIMRNLLSNAIKFSKKGQVVEVSCSKKSEEVCIKISDHGIGMDKEQLGKLFNNGVKSKRGTSGESGTGLGLIICKDFVENSGGHIQVMSEKGKGSTFMVNLPLLAEKTLNVV